MFAKILEIHPNDAYFNDPDVKVGAIIEVPDHALSPKAWYAGNFTLNGQSHRSYAFRLGSPYPVEVMKDVLHTVNVGVLMQGVSHV